MRQRERAREKVVSNKLGLQLRFGLREKIKKERKKGVITNR